MALGVKLEPVANLLSKEFFIRSYQRGYRWDEDHVNDLMNDFKDFIDSIDKLEDEFYCLQPIVVKLLSDIEKGKLSNFDFTSSEVYEVIDGQQRITTITILLHYLKRALQDEIILPYMPIIIYEVRPQSKKVLSNFNECIDSVEDSVDLDSNIDFYHMQIVYETITNWFKDNDTYKILFLKLLTSYKINCVKVIWYEVAEFENSIEVFRRFNVGKIPLTNAELIKALFLKENEQVPEAVKYSISKEWQHIENQLQSDFFWGFLNPSKVYTSRIEYIYDLLFESKRKSLEPLEKDLFDKKYGSDDDKVFRYFSSIISDSKDLLGIWDTVNAVFEKFVQWYHHAEHYHYIGFLQNKEGNTKKDNIVLDILLYKNKITHLGFQSKEELTNFLRAIIAGKTKAFFKDKKIALKYGDNSSYLRDLFFLFNVETCVKLSLSGNGEEIYKLPFNLNKEINYDIEHIDSKTEKEMSKLKSGEKVAYLKDIEVDFGYELGSVYEDMLAALFLNNDAVDKWEMDNIDHTKLDNILEKVFELIDQLLEKDSDKLNNKNVIGNLTLLNDSINRSYGNSYFSTKRRLIIENDKRGEYIPISTKNVFLKYYSGSIRKHTRWSESDSNSYQLEIETTLSKFI